MFKIENLAKIRKFQEGAADKDTFPIMYETTADVFYFDIDGERFYISANKLFIRRDKGFVEHRRVLRSER